MGTVTGNDLRQDRGWIKLGDGTYTVDVNSEGSLSTNPTFTGTSNTEGTQKKLFVNDDESRNLLSHILQELKILNMHMMVMTDNCFGKDEILE